MRPIKDIEQWLESAISGNSEKPSCDDLLLAGEEVLENWVVAKGLVATSEKREGFRLLALHRQGAQGDPSFNACRETSRELVYHYNLVRSLAADEQQLQKALSMMILVANHLCLFVSGKMQEAALGDFCCSAKPLHGNTQNNAA